MGQARQVAAEQPAPDQGGGSGSGGGWRRAHLHVGSGSAAQTASTVSAECRSGKLTCAGSKERATAPSIAPGDLGCALQEPDCLDEN